MPARVFVFDAYGTLFDVHAAIARHRDAAGPEADRLSDIWRAKQLEYAWMLSAAGHYVDFWTLTERALDYAFARVPSVDKALRATLLDAYFKLDAFPDAGGALSALKTKGLKTAILSNGNPRMLDGAVTAAGIGSDLDAVLSVDTIRIYKPQQQVYAMVTEAFSVAPADVAFVSSNRWDVMGAAAFGFQCVWVNRANLPDEYPEFAPVKVVHELSALPTLTLQLDPPRRIVKDSRLQETHMTEQNDILFDVRDGIGRVTFNRPQARNAFTFQMYERLAEICEEANKDRAIKVLIFTGAGDKAFASGTDINQFRAFATPQDAIDYEARNDRVLGVLEQCRVPTIAAIAGVCTGGGAAIAACCDLRIGTKTARFGFPIARTLGNCLSMANYSRLAALLGPARVKDIIFTARLVEAPEALALGLLSEVVEDVAALQKRADELATLLAGHAPLTLRATKEAMRRLQPRLSSDEGHDLILMTYMSKDFREGLDAFLTKRTPQWSGE